jgi:hypothetical protein
MIPFLAVLLVLPAAAQQQTCKVNERAPEARERFTGPLSSAGFDQGCIVMQQFQISNDRKVEIPHQGFLIVQIRAGSLFTGAEGERTEWREGSFWSVPAGQPLIVYTESDSVILQTVDFILQPRLEAHRFGEPPP